MFSAQFFIPDVPEGIEIQKKRQDFLVSKCVDETPDEDLDLVGEYAHDNSIRPSFDEQPKSGCCSFRKQSQLKRDFTAGNLPKLVAQEYPIEKGYTNIGI